jgi:hypothetical protein
MTKTSAICPRFPPGGPFARSAAVILLYRASYPFAYLWRARLRAGCGRRGGRPSIAQLLTTFCLIISLAAPIDAAVATAGGPNKNAYTLGLPRLQIGAGVGNLKPEKFDRDALNAPPGSVGVRKQTQRGVDYLAIDAAGAWSRPLRGSVRDVVFVSFCANASIGTEFEVGGAMLRVDRHKDPAKAQLMVAGRAQSGAVQWKPLGMSFGMDVYSGQSMAALPVLTLRLDPAAGVWDLYSG